jgi:hypothetical protein
MKKYASGLICFCALPEKVLNSLSRMVFKTGWLRVGKGGGDRSILSWPLAKAGKRH